LRSGRASEASGIVSLGRFIVFEGLDGSGTSTQLRLLFERLLRTGTSVEVTREPSNAPFGAVIRQAIEGRIHLNSRALALAFAGDREDHLTNEVNGIVPALERGSWVLCDRYVLSSLAYQTSDEVDYEWLVALNQHAPTPDATVFVDTPLDVCMERISSRSSHTELFHRRAELERVQKNYYRAIEDRRFVGHLVRVNGDDDPDIVFKELMIGLDPWLSQIAAPI
jgi:dTMP kinase